MKTGIELISEERQEQLSKHGYDSNHDDHVNMYAELQMAAEAIIEASDSQFPAGWDHVFVQKMCDKPELDRLVIAGALLMAEKDRIDRKIDELAAKIDDLQRLGDNE